MWDCPKCGTKVDPGFEVCWKCGTTVDGVEDPSFVPADEAEPISNDPEFTGLEPQLAPGMEILEALSGDPIAGEQPAELVECYWAGNVQEAQFLAAELIEQGIPAVADDDMLKQGLAAAAFGAPYFQPRVRVRPEDHARARAWLEEYEKRRKVEHGNRDA